MPKEVHSHLHGQVTENANKTETLTFANGPFASGLHVAPSTFEGHLHASKAGPHAIGSNSHCTAK